MKEQIKTEDIKKLNRDSVIFSVLLIVAVVSVIPLFLYLNFMGVTIWLLLCGSVMYYALRLEKQKKEHDIQTYKEILAFTEGKMLDEIERKREKEKRRYQAVVYAIGAAFISAAIAVVMSLLLS